MKKLIAVGGKAGSGKDYVLKRLCAYEAGRDGIVVISGFGDLVRRELGIRDPRHNRRLQQFHGQNRRQQDPLYWIKKAIEWGEWATTIGGADVAGMTGVRFPNEVEALQEGGFCVGLIEAPEGVRRQRLEARDGRPWTDEELNDITETSLDLIQRQVWDFIWENA